MDAVGTWLGVALAVAGFGVTWWQLWRTRTAAEAARDAAAAAERRFATNQLLILLSQLRQTETELHRACTGGNRDAVLEALLHWRLVGGEVLGVLPADNEAAALDGAIRLAIEVSAVSALTLVRDRRRTVASGTIDARVAISRAVAEASEYLGRLRTYSGGRHD